MDFKFTFSNYCTTSNIDKILRRFVYNCFHEFLGSNNLTDNQQFAFRQKHFTSHALTKKKEQLNKGNFESGLFFDFQRHLTQLIMIFLIKKWITMIYEVQLIIGFLHIFQIELICIINGFFIRTRFIRCCIPQVSILESSLFLIYKNDLHMQ